ncbi:MAG: MBL fold metallo-hydrolase [Selenomonadaceae bacterium]|nr:MBL fold metallo-hydrolase [Selenomonadaceae bacterium]
MKSFKLTVLGARGSVSVSGKDFSVHGGATSCYRVQAGDEEIYLDAGTGIVNATPLENSRITILLTHLHLDHVIGLPFFAALTHKDRPIDIYARERAGFLPKEAIDRLIDNPFWPAKIDTYPAKVTFHIPPKRFSIGAVEVDTLEGCHPGGSTIYKLTYQGKSLVYATDFEHEPKACAALTTFAKDCDLLLYDAQYTAAEYERFKGYGHSTPEEGIKIAELANVKKLLFVHHAPWRTDKDFAQMQHDFARINQEIIL